MKRAAAVTALILAACATTPKPADEPNLVPPPQPVALPSATLEARINDLQTSMTELLDRLDVLDARIARLETRATAPPSAPAPAPVEAADIADKYRQALVLFGQGKHADARAVFQQVFAADPGGQLADNALFWIAETYFSAGDYNAAIPYYQRVIREYPQQNKAPDALFKIGMAYVKTGDLGMARRTFQECIQKYPYSSPASSSKRELKRIQY